MRRFSGQVLATAAGVLLVSVVVAAVRGDGLKALIGGLVVVILLLGALVAFITEGSE